MTTKLADKAPTTRTLATVALLSAVASGGLFQLYLSQVQARANGGSPVSVVALTRDLSVGERLDAEALVVRNLPDRYVESRHIHARDLERIVGMQLRNARLGHETLLWSDLAGIDAEGLQLSDLVRPGMRAVTVDLRRSGIERLLQPGDRIDLLCGEHDGGPEGEPARASVLDNVLVLAVGTDLGAAVETDGRRRDGRITVAVTTGDAHALAGLQRCGGLTAALRNPEDVVTVDLRSERPGSRR